MSHGKLLVECDLWNSSVFNLFRKVCRYCDAVITDGGRLFLQVRAAAIRNERSPLELRNVVQTISAGVDADRSLIRGLKTRNMNQSTVTLSHWFLTFLVHAAL